MKNLWDSIKELREDKDVTQAELASKLKKSVKTIQRYESGETIPSTSTLKKIGDILGQKIITDSPISIKYGSITEPELTDMVLQNNAMLSVSLDALAEILAATNPKKTVSEARSSLAKAVEHRIEIVKGRSKS